MAELRRQVNALNVQVETLKRTVAQLTSDSEAKLPVGGTSMPPAPGIAAAAVGILAAGAGVVEGDAVGAAAAGGLPAVQGDAAAAFSVASGSASPPYSRGSSEFWRNLTKSEDSG